MRDWPRFQVLFNHSRICLDPHKEKSRMLPQRRTFTFVLKTFHFKLLSITATALLAVVGGVVSVHSSKPRASSEETTDARSGAKAQEGRGEAKTSHSKTPTLTVSGGITLNSAFQPLLFTWNSAVTVQGSHWQPGETVSIILQ